MHRVKGKKLCFQCRSCSIVKRASQFRSIHTAIIPLKNFFSGPSLALQRADRSYLIWCFISYGHIFFAETDSVSPTTHRPIYVSFLREWGQATAIICTVKSEVARSSFSRSADWAGKDTFGVGA